MRGHPGHRRTPRRRQPSTPEERQAALRDYAIKLHDKGDGHGVDWALVAASLFTVGFSCLRETPPGDARAQTVARRTHDAAYSLMSGTPDSDMPYAAERPEGPPFTADFLPGPGLDHTS